MDEVIIPDNPEVRQYNCPFCSKQIKCFRIGNSSSYLVMDGADTTQQHDCKSKTGAIPISLLYKKPAPVKGNKP